MRSTLFMLIAPFTFITSHAQKTYTEITLPELMKKKQQGKEMVIIDVRSDGEYYDSATDYMAGNIGRLKGAVHVDVNKLRENPESVKQLEQYKDKDVYLICSHSYRSRAASRILLNNGFTHVNNVQGGMTEFYRRYEELAPFMPEFYETATLYKNISPSQLYKQLSDEKKVLLIGISSVPKYFWDSASVRFYKYFPILKNAMYLNYADSLKVLAAAKKQNGPVVLFNMVNNGAAELADWLTRKGIDASYLVGGDYYFYEYVENKGLLSKAGSFTRYQSAIHFITPPLYCNKIKAGDNIQLVDLRPDSLFNKVNDGTKYDYKHLKEAVNFFADNGENAFARQFTDKKKEYVLISSNGTDGIELADALTKKGYTIYWVTGGLNRWEWYMNNMEDFPCMDRLVF